MVHNITIILSQAPSQFVAGSQFWPDPDWIFNDILPWSANVPIWIQVVLYYSNLLYAILVYPNLFQSICSFEIPLSYHILSWFSQITPMEIPTYFCQAGVLNIEELPCNSKPDCSTNKDFNFQAV